MGTWEVAINFISGIRNGLNFSEVKMLFFKRKLKKEQEIKSEIEQGQEFKSKFEQDLKETISECKKELAARKAGIIGDCTIDEIENFILPELYHFLYLSMRDVLPPKKERWLCIAHEFAGGMVNISASYKCSKMVDMIMDLRHKYFA